MSRYSLRLDDGLLDRSLPHGSASFSIGGGGGIWRNTRSLKSRRSQQHSVSCSDSLLVHTPRKLSGQLLHNSVASDASLLSSLLDESSLQESTLVDTLWGLDNDNDPKESTVIAEQSTVVADTTLTDSDGRCANHPVQTLSRVYCKDHEPSAMYSSPLKYTFSSASMPEPSHHEEPESSTIYCRDRKRKSRTDVLWLDVSGLCVSAAACCVSALTHTWKVSRRLVSVLQADDKPGARCGGVSLKESTTTSTLHPNGSQCKTAGEAFRCLSKRWLPSAGLLLSRFPLRLLLVLLPVTLFLLSFCWFGPAGLQSVLPFVDLSQWRTLSSIYSSFSGTVQGAVESRALQPYQELSHSPPPPQDASGAEDESARLVHLEQSLATLWQHVEAGGQRAEQRHRELLQLYTDLQQQQLTSAPSDGEAMKPWLSSLLDQQLSQLRTRLDQEGRQREQDLLQQQSQASRLDRLELQLQTLAARTEKMQWRQEAAATVSPSPTLPAAISVDRQSHDALLAEVAQLEEALENIRQDVKGLSEVQNSCQQLDRIQQTISTQVREEVQALVYGNQLTVGGRAPTDEGSLPESLLQWLSQQYVTESDLQAALASLERSLLQNISQQLEQRFSEDTVTHDVPDAAGAAGASVTQEDVHAIVKNALRLFSQDRTGLADYALESGGGSVLSTRCSETYQTKAALLSLFGVPLWYFSQSPRAVIQPEVHPGNCWAFRGSSGFLVIRLSMSILPTAFSLEHIPKALTPSGTLLSAPRDFSVYGLDDENQESGKLLGSYTYDEDGEALQTYAVAEENDRAFQIIEVKVLSNWGNEEYTCMYRFRVHGTPSDA